MKRKVLIGVLVGICLLVNNGAVGVQELSVSEENIKKIMTNDFDMVLIGPERFEDLLQPLIDHKNLYGINTFFKSTTEIYDEYDGRDAAEQIKYFIKDAIEQFNIRFVLLVGGRIGQSFKWYVPCRYSHVDDGYMHKMILSDLYFADVYKANGDFEDWDNNGNGVYAEWTGMMAADKMDLVPDISLGRLPCRSSAELKNIVNKIIDYEQNNEQTNKQILLVGGDTNPGIGEPFPYEGESCCDWTLTYLPDFTYTRIYTSDGSLSNKDDFISAFNEDNLFVLYHGHGLQDRLVTYKPNSHETVSIIHNNDLDQLLNSLFPVMVVGCCQTTDFDTSVLNFLDVFNNLEQHHYFKNFKYECVSECIGWNMVKQPETGSIAHLGSSSTAWGSTGDSNHDDIPDSAQFGFTSGICTAFFQNYSENSELLLGELYRNALTQVIEENNAQNIKIQCKCVQEFILLGDPSLKIGGYSS